MTWADDAAWYDARWEAIPAEQRERIVAFLRERLSEKDLARIREMHAEDPEDWATKAPAFFHMWGGGMAIRNLLRELMLDDELPPAPYPNGETYSNWDDYYVQALEAAAGVREA